MTFQCIGSDAYCKAMAETAQLGLLVLLGSVTIIAILIFLAKAMK